jgi:hypothetical protein
MGGWVYHRQRLDKKEPNFHTVAISTWRSIVTSIDEDRLIEVCNEIELEGQGADDNKRMREELDAGELSNKRFKAF